MSWIIATIFAMAEETVLFDDLRTTEDISYSEETIYRQRAQSAMIRRLAKKYRVVGDHNFIPEMEKSQKSMNCVNANCALNMARDLGMNWLVTSDWTDGYLSVTLLDVKANKPVCSDMRGPEGRSLLLTYEPDPIINCLNNRVSWLPRVRVAPPPAERVRDIAVAAVVVAPILYIFVDNFSNIAEK